MNSDLAGNGEGGLRDPERLEPEGAPASAEISAQTTLGAVHLTVADLMATPGSQAAFLCAGGYHHHIGADIWESAGASPPPPGSASLRHGTVGLPSSAERDSVLARVAEAGQEQQDLDGNPSVRDPAGNVLVLTVGV